MAPTLTLTCDVCGRRTTTVGDDQGNPLLPGDWQKLASQPEHLVCSFECAAEMRERMSAPTTPIELEPSRPSSRKKN